MGELYRLSFPNGKTYIGVSFFTAQKRFKQHLWSAKKSNQLAYRAWRKHGEPMLKVLAVVENVLLHEIEIKAIASYGTLTPNGYNMTLGGDGTPGLIHSLETRAKFSIISKARIYSAETRKKIGAKSKGRKLSPESSAKKSATLRALMAIPEERAKRGRKGKRLSPEHRAKISASHTGKKISPGTKARLASYNVGRVFTAEHRANLSASAENRVCTPETKAKMQCSARQHYANLRLQGLSTAPSPEALEARRNGIKQYWTARRHIARLKEIEEA